MKRLLIFFLFIILCFSLIACSNRKESMSNDFTEATSSEIPISSDSAQASIISVTDQEDTTTAIEETTVLSTNTTTSKTVISKSTATKQPTIPTIFLPTTEPPSTSETTTSTQIDQLNDEPTIEDAYNLYLYSLYTVQSTENICIRSNKNVVNQNYLLWKSDMDINYYNNTLNMEVKGSSKEGSYYRRYYYDGAKMFNKNGQDYETEDTIYYPLTMDQLHDNYYIYGGTAERFCLDEVTSYESWKAGGTELGLKFKVTPNQALKPSETELKCVMNNDNIILNTVQDYICDVYINTQTYFIERFEIWIEAKCMVNGNEESLSYHLAEYYSKSGGLLEKPYWTSDAKLVECPV